MSSGWIPAHRKLFDPTHHLAPSKRDPACRAYAWLDLCQMATHQPRETRASGTLGRGELVASLRTLGERWGWSKDRVLRFISAPTVMTAIETVRETPDGTVYRIVNYDTYAVPRNGERDSQRDGERDRDETAARQEQEVNNKTRTTSRRRTALPNEWVPSDSHRDRAVRDRLNLEYEVEGFRNYHLGQGTMALDWDRTFFTWLRNAVRFASKNGQQAGATNGKRPGYLTPAKRTHANP